MPENVDFSAFFVATGLCIGPQQVDICNGRKYI